MTFLTRMLGPIVPSNADQRTAKAKSGDTRSERVQAEYAKLFAEPTTVAKAAAEHGVDHVAMLNQIYRYEKKGLIERAGIADAPGRPLLFLWKGNK